MAKEKKQQASAPAQTNQSALDVIKAKLRAKYHLLKDDPLHQNTLEDLKNHVCTVLGMNRPDLDWQMNDL